MKNREKTGTIAVITCWSAAAFLVAAAQIISLCFNLKKK